MKDAIGHAGSAMLLSRERLHAVLFRQHAASRASRERIRDHAVNGLLQHDGDVTVAVSRYRRLDARIVVDYDVRRRRRLPVATAARGDSEIAVGAALQRHDRLRPRLTEQRHRRDGRAVDDATPREWN